MDRYCSRAGNRPDLRMIAAIPVEDPRESSPCVRNDQEIDRTGTCQCSGASPRRNSGTCSIQCQIDTMDFASNPAEILALKGMCRSDNRSAVAKLDVEAQLQHCLHDILRIVASTLLRERLRISVLIQEPQNVEKTVDFRLFRVRVWPATSFTCVPAHRYQY